MQSLCASDLCLAGWQGDLAVSHQSVGDALLDAGRREEALAAYTKALEIYEKLAAAEPDDTMWQQRKSVAYKIGDIWISDEDSERTHSMPIARALRSSKNWPPAIRPMGCGNVTLSTTYQHIGDILVDAGRRVEAIEAYLKSLAISERLAKADPQNTEWQRDLFVSYIKAGNVINQPAGAARLSMRFAQAWPLQPDWPPATPEMRVGNGTSRSPSTGWPTCSLPAKDFRKRSMPTDKVLRSRSSWPLRIRPIPTRNGIWLFHTARMALRWPNWAVAKKPWIRSERDLAIMEKLAAADPGNLEWQRDLSVNYSKTGDVLGALGRNEEALDIYRKDLAITTRLAAADPGNALWQRDLSISYERLGDRSLYRICHT